MARILIVDGDPSSRDPIQRALAQEGLEVISAGDADAAWEAFVAFSPSVALLGRGLDRRSAEDLIVRMRRADATVRFVSPAPPWTEMARALRVELGAPAPRDIHGAPGAHPGSPCAVTGSLPPRPALAPGLARVLARPPLESGTLAFGTLPDLLARLWRSAADGVVAIEGPRGVDRVLVLRGVVAAVRPAAAGTAADPEDALADLCATAEGPYAFHPGADFAAEVRADRVPGLAPLLAGLRRGADEPSFLEALRPIAAAVLRRSAASAAVLRELDLAPDDAATAAAIDGATPVEVLLRGRGRPASLVWFLLRSGGAEVARDAATAAAPSLEAPAPLDRS